MNLRAFAHLIGARPKPQTYGHNVKTFDLSAEGRVQLAQWLHPNETAKELRQDVIDHLRTFLRPGDVAIDIGAHTGDTTVPMALAVGANGRVFALEPNPYVFPVLQANASLNTASTSVVPLNFAATAAAGPVTFSYSDSGFCNGGEHAGVSRWRHAHAFNLEVRGENLGVYLRERHPEIAGRVRFIKVDAEGADLSVLRSLADLVERERPFIRAEVHKLVPEPGRLELFEWLTGRGYVVHRVAGETSYAGERLTPADLGKWRQFDLFAVPQPLA